MKFQNKSVLITGAAVGIGRAAAILFAAEGTKLVLLDTNIEKLEAVKAELSEFTSEVLIYECDISDETRVKEVVADAVSKLGHIDILVNNAAVWRTWKPFLETDSDEWRKFFDINVHGTVYVTKAVLPGMIENSWGRIVNVASVAGVYGNANMVQYSATKGAVISMTKGLAKEVADKGITVNAVSPGTVSSSDDENIDSFRENALNHMGRTGTDRENAALILYLASEEAAYISGQNILIDGCRKII